MAKNDIDLNAGMTITDISVSKKAEDRILRLRRELRSTKAEYDTLIGSLSGAKTYGERESILLGAREAGHRISSLSRRLGQTPSEMMEALTLTTVVNKQLNSNRRAEAAETRAIDSDRARKEKEKELYNQVTKTYKKLEDKDADTPSGQLQRASVRSGARRLLQNQWFGGGTLTPNQLKKVTDIYDKLSENTDATTNLMEKLRSNIAAGAGGIAFGSMISGRAAAILGERETPFSMLRDEVNKGIKYTSGVIGAAIGGLAGPLGAAIGGAIGAIVGGYAERTKAASDAAKQDAIQMLRMRNLYSRGSFNSAMLAQNLGYISTEDYNQIASGINIAPYAAAFGEISDRQWIGYSLLPNYMAAVFAGAEPEEAMDALQRDIDGLPSGLAQQAVNMLGNLGPGENVRAFVQSPNYRRWREAGYTLSDYEERLKNYAPGYEEAIMNEGLKNRETRDLSVRRGTWTASKYNYVGQPAGGTGAEVLNDLYSVGALPRFDLNEMGFVKRELVINIDNNRVDVGTVYTFDGDWLQGATSYSVGSNQ